MTGTRRCQALLPLPVVVVVLFFLNMAEREGEMPLFDQQKACRI